MPVVLLRCDDKDLGNIWKCSQELSPLRNDYPFHKSFTDSKVG